MDSQKHDKTFFVTFLFVLGFIGAFTLAIIFIANTVSARAGDEAEVQARVEERIKPLGEVITDEKMLLAAAPPAVARAPMTGPEIVTKVCGACHASGVLNAPKIGDKAAWAPRLAAGLNAVVANAIKGKNQMPPRGGDPSLSDAEIKAAVQQLIK